MRGESTEATAYDSDGYIVGERVSWRRPLFGIADAVSVARAYLGDLADANAFRRLPHLDRANYVQVLVQKRTAMASLSVDYTSHAGTRVVRGAAFIDTSGLRVADRVRVEHYARLHPSRGYGYAVMAQRHVTRGVVAGAGWSHIDQDFGMLNGDLYGVGRRLIGALSRRIDEVWLASLQVARTIGNDSSRAPGTRVDVALAYDLLRSVRSKNRASAARGRRPVDSSRSGGWGS